MNLHDHPLLLRRLGRIRSTMDHITGGLLALLMGLAVLNVLWQVTTRFILVNPSSFTDELARYMLIWIGILGGTYAAGSRLNLAIDLLPRLLTGPPRLFLQVFIDGAILLFALSVLVLGGGRLVYLAFMLKQTSAALQVPLGFVYLILPLSGLVLVLYKLIHLAELRSTYHLAAQAQN